MAEQPQVLYNTQKLYKEVEVLHKISRWYKMNHGNSADETVMRKRILNNPLNCSYQSEYINMIINKGESARAMNYLLTIIDYFPESTQLYEQMEILCMHN